MRVRNRIADSFKTISTEAKVVSGAFGELTEVFREFMSGDPRGFGPETLERCGLNKVVANNFGVRLQVEVDSGKQPICIIQSLIFRSESDFRDKFRNSLKRSSIMQLKKFEAFDALSSHDFAWVDRNKGKCGGAFSDVLVPIKFTRSIFDPAKMKPEELAAIVIQQISHAFAYFETLGRSIYLSYFIETQVEAFGKANSQAKLDILKTLAAKDFLDKSHNPNKMTSLSSGELYTLLMSNNLLGTNSPLPTENSLAQKSINFAASFGAGPTLKAAGDKVMSVFGMIFLTIIFFPIIILACYFIAVLLVVTIITLLWLSPLIIIVLLVHLLVNAILGESNVKLNSFDDCTKWFGKVTDRVTGAFKKAGLSATSSCGGYLDSMLSSFSRVKNGAGDFLSKFTNISGILGFSSDKKKQAELVEKISHENYCESGAYRNILRGNF